MENKGKRELIDELVSNCEKALFQDFGSGAWAEFWFSKTLETIQTANLRIKSLAEHKMLIFDPAIEVRPFWVEIMKTAQTSIWTTDFPSRFNFGSSFLENTLLLQKSAIEDRAVKITRLFVYDPENFVEIANLRTALAMQLYYGIKVYVIPKNVFASKSTNIGEHLGSDDFMIMDDKFVYETEFHLETASFRNRLVNRQEEYESKKRIVENVMKFAVAIHSENVNHFPNIL
jgi:hypothetical protein